MNNKTKIMLGLSALTAGTLAAGATGTLAWFTTNKTATATYNNITVQGTQGNLNVSIKGVTTYGNDAIFGATAETKGKAFISDVSSQDGLAFTQPNWKTSAGNNTDLEINGVNTVTEASGYFTQYLVTIKNVSKKEGADDTNAAASTKLNVSLSSVSITGGTNALTWTHVAINQNVVAKETDKDSYLVPESGKTASLLAFFQEEDKTKNQYVSNAVANPITMGQVLKTCTTAPTLSSETKAENFVTLENNKSITLGVSVWLEGTMADTQDTAKGEQVAVTLTFTGAAA